eukprot:6457808-Amphidinium_carterae.2
MLNLFPCRWPCCACFDIKLEHVGPDRTGSNLAMRSFWHGCPGGSAYRCEALGFCVPSAVG